MPVSLVFLAIVGCSVVGIVLTTLGLRGRPVFSFPRCSTCTYDLRAMNFMSGQIGQCPECGADLTRPEQVTFGQLARHRGWIGGGIALLTVPWLLIPIIAWQRHGATSVAVRNSSNQTTASLLASLPNTVTRPNDWQELSRRLKGGLLTASDIDSAFDILTKHLSRPGQRSYIPWATEFVNGAIQNRQVGAEPLKAYLSSSLGSAPTVKLRSRVRVNAPMKMSFDMEQTPTIEVAAAVWSLKSIEAEEGLKLDLPRVARSYNSPFHPDQLSGRSHFGARNAELDHGLPVGEHELTLTFDMGAVPPNSTMRGLDGNPGTLDKWPSPMATWRTAVKRKVQVVAADQPVISLAMDEARNPVKGIAIAVEELLARPSSDGVEVVVKFRVEGMVNLPMGYRASFDVGEQRINLGTLLIPTSASQFMSSSRGVRMKSLPPTPRTVDVTLTPDPLEAENMDGVDEIWGGTHVIRNVELQRYDAGK